MVAEIHSLQMEDDDLCIILTIGGDFVEIFSDDFDLVIKEADMIMDHMICLLKLPEHQFGVWVWRIKLNGLEIQAEEIFCD